jgi:2-haloacid dehalogenase
MITSVFFDLDETILDFSKAEANALSRTLCAFGIEPTAHVIERYHEVNISQWRLMEEGKLSRVGVLTRRFELLFAELGWDVDVVSFNDQYETFLGEGHFFLPGAEAVLKELAPHYHLYLATNGASSVQRGRLKSAGLEPWFEGIFISEEVGYNKPSVEYFKACFSQIKDFDPATAVIVGDSLTSDIRGGKNAGIRTCWLNRMGNAPDYDIIPDCTIRTLEELPALLKQL